MPSSPHRFLRRLVPSLLLVVCAATPLPAQEAGPSAHVAELKRMQVRLMMRGAQRRLDRHLAARRLSIRPAPWRPGVRAGSGRRPAVTSEPPDPAGRSPREAAGDSPKAGAAPASGLRVASDQIVNDRSTDGATCPSAPCTGLPWSGQCEVSIGASGRHLVAAWNDGEGFETGLSTQGYGYSTDNGASWIDGGIPPVTGGVTEWTSDPVIAVNEKTGAFYYAGLCSPSATTNGIAVVRGAFVNGAFTWGTPRIVVSANNVSALYDKEWLAVDSLSGNLYVAYSRFTVSGGSILSNEIQFSRNTGDNAVPWSSPVKLSAVGDDGRVQGVRVAVGPAGEVYATWSAIGMTALDYMRFRRSTNFGTIWGTLVDATSLYTNFGTGAPGFNRGLGFAFPGLAVDRGTGPHRGRIHVTWNESLNFFDDPLGETGTIIESEGNDTPVTADGFTPGNTLRGDMSSSTDFDYWSFSGVQGQTIICELDTIFTTTLNASFRLFCTDGATRLAFSETGSGGGDFATGLIVFTLPTTGTYYLRVAPFEGTGGYRIRTGLNGAVTERGRDHRDVFLARSDDGASWSVPARVNGDAPYYDNWLPEVAVARNGNVYLQWYDWRDAPASVCAGASMSYLSRSTDGGVSWPDGSPVSQAPTFWTTAYSNIMPNQGDYTAVFASQHAAYVCWSDGRHGDPDIFMSVVDLACTPVTISPGTFTASPGQVRATWVPGEGANVFANVYRLPVGGGWTAVGQISSGGTGVLAYDDRNVVEGAHYDYRLGVLDPCGETVTGEVGVDVPVNPRPVIERVQPNPAASEIWVSLVLPFATPATLELLDIGGRRVRELQITTSGPQTIDLSKGVPVPAGVYMVRLTQNGVSVTARVSVMR